MADTKPDNSPDLRLRRFEAAAPKAKGASARFDSRVVGDPASLTTTDLPHLPREDAQRRNTPKIFHADIAQAWGLRPGERLDPAIINYDPQQFRSVSVEVEIRSRGANPADCVALLSVTAQRVDTEIPLKFTIETPRIDPVKMPDPSSKTGFRNFMILLETAPLRVAVSEELLADLIKNADPEDGAVVRFRSAERSAATSEQSAKAKIRSA